MLNLTAGFGVKTKAKLTQIFELREKLNNSKQSKLSNPDSNFCVNFLTYILSYQWGQPICDVRGKIYRKTTD